MTTSTRGNAGRVSKGRLQRLQKTAQYAAMGGAMMVAGTSGAWAQCVGTTGTANGGQFTAAQLVPFGKGVAVASVISTISSITTSSVAQSGAFTGSPPNAREGQTGGGVWVRETGGYVDTEANSTTRASDPARNFTGTEGCNIKTETTFNSTQLGFDIARLNVLGGANFFLGVTAGYSEATSKDRTIGESTFSSEWEVPFAGVYAGLNAGAVSLDAQVRWDAFRGTLTDNIATNNTAADFANQALYGQLMTANAISLLWNAAYRYDVKGTNWFVEPSIGGIWSRTSVDPFDFSGNFIIAGQGLTSPGTIVIDDIHTLLGRASVRVGTTIVQNNVAVQPFATASVFHEFAGNVNARGRAHDDQIGFASNDQTADISTSRVGTYGHIGLGIAGTILDTGWLGFVRGDYRFGDNIDSLTFNAGVRYQFTPPKMPGMKDEGGSYVAKVNWTGPYIGAFGGALFSQTDWVEAAGDIGPRASGGIAGGTLGYNIQVNHLVLGIEGDWGYSNADGSNGCPGTVQVRNSQVRRQYFYNCHSEVSSLAIIAGRIGHTWDRALIYVKGGIAIGEVENSTTFNPGDTPLFFNNQPANTSGSASDTLVGWAIGGGIEFALTDSWSAKGEYMHFDLGSEKFTLDRGNVVDAGVKGDTVRIGVNYRFGHRGEEHHEGLK
ncbi:MAG: autotransporter domain-containing protein [Hyphomicrobiaceae bacterium]